MFTHYTIKTHVHFPKYMAYAVYCVHKEYNMIVNDVFDRVLYIFLAALEADQLLPVQRG